MTRHTRRPEFPSRFFTTAIAVTVAVGIGAGLVACSTGPAVSGASGVDGEIMTTTAPVADTCTGVEVVVDFGILDQPPVNTCIDIEATTPAKDVLAAAAVTLTGTDAYGDAVVCRVNDQPSATVPVTVDGHDPYTETCASMPPEYAYWALWVKQGSPDWSYALVGANDLRLSPGESIGLVFTSGTSTPTPN